MYLRITKNISSEYSLLKVYDKVNKTNFKSKDCDWFPLQALIDEIFRKESPSETTIQAN